MQQGTVKWFDDEKGYGFIAPHGGGKDIFVHYSGIEGSGRRSLEGPRVEVDEDGTKRSLLGDEVNYETEDTDRGLQAVKVAKIDALDVEAGNDANTVG